MAVTARELRALDVRRPFSRAQARAAGIRLREILGPQFPLAGLPEPTVHLIIRNPDGSWRMRFDPSYLGLKLIIEYDGRQHAETSGQWRRDLSRREELDRQGWRLIVVTSDDLHDASEAVLNRVREALIDRGAVGIRRRFKTEWIRYFASDA